MTALRQGLRIAALALVAVSIGGVALAATPERARLPIPRPMTAAEKEAAEAATSEAAEPSDAVRLPRPRPAVEPPTETAAWAGDAEEHFQSAAESSDGPPPAEIVQPATASVPDPEDDAAADGAPTAIGAIETLAPLPRPRPSEDHNPSELALVAPRSSDVAPEAPASSSPPNTAPPKASEIVKYPDEPTEAGCFARIRALGVEFTEEAPLDPGGACAVEHPLNVTSLGQGVSIEPKAVINCRTTESLARWVQEIVLPTARKRLDATLTGIVHDSTYVCRPRNNVRGAKLSEHGIANAVDIATFRFDGHDDANVGKANGEAGVDFEAEIRSGACRYFTTVLGPGSNAAHATHFHLDMAVRRHGYRLCELGAPSIARAR